VDGRRIVLGRSVKSLWLVLVPVLLLAACSSGEPNPERKPRPDVDLLRADVPRIESPDVSKAQMKDLVRGNNDFAFDLYRAGEGGGNLVFSPYSISLAFSMAYVGARGETEAQIADTLHFLPQETQHPAFNVLDGRMSGPGAKSGGGGGEPFELNVANAVWGQRGYPFRDAYLETLAGHYGAGLRTMDFGDPVKASREINAWISARTEGHIKDLVSPEHVSPPTRMVLANAVYFKASWLYSFEESNTKDGPFITPDGSKVNVPMMRQTGEFSYAEDDGYRAIRLPYEGDRADMLIILPEEGRFEEVEGRLDADLLEEAQGRLEPRYVRLTMPRFDFESDLELLELLEGMGMTAPFDPDRADFGGIAKERLYISAALHQATVTVDEKGTEATAATVLGMAESAGAPSPQAEMKLDRPFIFAVTGRGTGTVLFLGRVTDPSE
jgi:serpin B